MKKKTLIILLLAMLLLILIGTASAVILDNGVEVQPDTELTYYLDITCDGVDKYGTESSDTTTAQIKSGYIYVEDKIPDGLEFVGFVTTSNGSIGAEERTTGTSCSGSVVDDTKEATTTTGTWSADNTEYTYHGLHYTKSDRTVRFAVKNLKAGGVLTVGIITKTPASVDDPTTAITEIRRDFYNFATAVEGMLSAVSNTVHVYMGSSDATLYNVKYEIEGEMPEVVPSLPSQMSYAEGVSVGVAPNIDIEGYTFSGWSSSNATISSGSFIMPAGDVVLKGSFTKENKYKVTYTIDGDKPKDYILPIEKEYYENATVIVDSLKAGDIVDGYKFLGWTTNDVTISEDNDFVMENKNVTITGKFEQIKYKVEYRFYDTLVPPNSDSLLPETKEYAPGAKVTVENVNNVDGYKFLGWYKEDTFKMPEEDVVIYGEWMKVTGTFEPKIEIEILDKKEKYRAGDTVEFKITVTNQNDFEIREVIVSENNKDIEFKEHDGYKKESANFATIDTIEANGKVYLYATYTVTSDDEGEITNEVEILGALADNDYVLEEKEYKADCKFDVTKEELGKNIYSVTYKIDGDRPDGYNVPEENEYKKWKKVKIDSLKSGDIVNGYKFLGWETSDVQVDENGEFVVGESNIVFVGKFEKVESSGESDNTGKENENSDSTAKEESQDTSESTGEANNVEEKQDTEITQDKEKNEVSNSENARTGDKIIMYILSFIIAVIGFGVILKFKRKM